LVHGFRRLQALERKREHEVLPSDPSTGYTYALANPLEPSILLSTLCSNSNSNNNNNNSGPKNKKHASPNHTNATTGGNTASAAETTVTQTPNVDVSTIWEESGIGLTCCKICPPDGRRVAVGCDDAAIRIWDLMNPQGDGSMGEPAQVLLGHKNGFPIFDVDWNRDGRSLLSAGGDGSVRLWDTMAQGPFGTVTRVKPSSATMASTKKSSAATEKASNAQAKERLEKATKALEQAKANPDMVVPGLKQEDNPYTSGAALAVYRGHAPNTPVWSVAFAPCGYYFASAGADATARLWTTDRASPVRLFTGHTSKSVNSVVFHPNCNYILTGSEDKTARLWDIQTGRCVRLLTGCAFGINVVKVSPSGQYAAGADYSGIVHLWDLGSGKKVTEFRPNKVESNPQQNTKSNHHHQSMIHSLSFSACGTALATGGDDGCVKVWDVRKTATESKPVCDAPSKRFETRRTMIMDLQYTKRNLLLSMGKYATAVPVLATPIAN
jgi:WD40 repeat protein